MCAACSDKCAQVLFFLFSDRIAERSLIFKKKSWVSCLIGLGTRLRTSVPVDAVIARWPVPETILLDGTSAVCGFGERRSPCLELAGLGAGAKRVRFSKTATTIISNLGQKKIEKKERKALPTYVCWYLDNLWLGLNIFLRKISTKLRLASMNVK